MNQSKPIISALALMLTATMAEAQTAVVPAGGEAIGQAGSVTYTIGQPFAGFAGNENGSINIGVQQPYIIGVVPPPDGIAELQAEFAVYPNPTTDAVTVTTTESDSYSYELLAETGAVVKKDDFDESCLVEMSAFVPSTYMLRISNKKGQMKVFRIVKQ